MRRLFFPLLAVCIALCFACPALGAEERGFSDVSPDDWFAPYVEVCVEEGLMKGVGAGAFAPERQLTLAEALVLTVRLHARNAGVELPHYALPADPNDLVRICDETGTQVGNFGDLQVTMMGSPRKPMFLRLDDQLLERVGTEARLTLTIDVRGLGYYTSFRDFQDKAYVHESVGYEEHLRQSGELERGYAFAQEEDDLWPLLMGLDRYIESNGDVYRSISANTWWRDENLYLTQLFAVDGVDPFPALETAWAADDGLLASEHMGVRTSEELAALSEEELLSWPCLRGDLAALICSVIPAEDLAPRWENTPPDTGLEAALTLYQAGVLAGVDEVGTFFSAGPLTRAEAAAVCARVLRPELRMDSSLEGGEHLGQ